MSKFNAYVASELNHAKRHPDKARIYGTRCQAMFEVVAYMANDDTLLETWETAFRPVFEAYENAYLKGVFPDEND